MFRSIFDTIVGKISNLNPIKHFIKYAIDKTLNEFLQKQLTLQDFKNGPLNLQNIQINTLKINNTHLVGSPYVMHYGIIQNMKISLPPLSQISTQSIEISISGIQITLKPNKKFSQNFKQKMMQLHEMQKYQVEQKVIEGQISETGPVDFFKELLKKIIMNIKVNIKNVAIKLYMNTPSQTKQSPQFYLMLRVPFISLDKKEDKQKMKNEVQQIKFNLTLPQITLHLLREDTKYPDFPNIPYNNGDFPFKYPTVSHPSTVFLLGSPTLPENNTKNNSFIKMNFIQIGFKLVTDYKKKTKETSISLYIPNFQVMATPVQIKIMSRFIIQILQFKKLLNKIVDELKYQATQSISINRSFFGSKDKQKRNSGNTDIFSSIVMRLSTEGNNPMISNSRENNDIFMSIISDDRAMRESVRQFNVEFKKKAKQQKQVSILSSVQFQAIQFKQSLKISFDLSRLNVYILKYLPNHQYYRRWMSESAEENIVNKKIGCDYFMVNIKKIEGQIKAKEKETEVRCKSLKMYNVKLHGPKEQSVDEYYDMKNSVDLESSGQNSGIYINKIQQFEIPETFHFCTQEIISICQSESQKKSDENQFKKYCFIPQMRQTNEDAYILYKHAIVFKADDKKKSIKIGIEVVNLSLNLQIIQDFLNIIYPLMAYKKLANIISFIKNQIIQKYGDRISQKKQSHFLESMYEYRYDIQSLEDLKKQNQNVLVVQVQQTKISYRKNQSLKKQKKCFFEDLIHQQKQKINQQDSFSKDCFCDINENGLYLQILALKLEKKLSTIKIRSKAIDVGIMKISNSNITNISSILLIKSTKQQDMIRILKQNTHCELLQVYLPAIESKLSDDDIFNIVCIISDSVKIINQIVIYKEYLAREILFLQENITDLPKKAKRNESTLQKQIKIYIEKVHIQLNYFSVQISQPFIKLTPQSDQKFVCKISRIIAGVKRQQQHKPCICQFKNNVMLTRMYLNEKQKMKAIADDAIFFQMGEKQLNKFNLREDDRINFYEKLQKHNFGFVTKFSKKETERGDQGFFKRQSQIKSKSKISNYSQGASHKAFAFKQKHQNPAIQQQGEKKTILLEITKQIHIYATNLIELIDHAKKIQDFIKKIKQKLKQTEQKLNSQKNHLIDRKHSVQIQSELFQLNAKLSSSILIDIRPDFIKKKGQRIFSNTRSVLSLRIHDQFKFMISQDKNQKQVSFEMSLNYYFLKSEDRQIQLNPILLKQQNILSDQGFKKILQINHIRLHLLFSQDSNKFQIQIKSIFGQISIESICLLQLHFQQFINHHIKKQPGLCLSQIYEGDDFCVLDYDPEADSDLDEVVIVGSSNDSEFQDIQVQDLTEKKDDEALLRNRNFTFESCHNPTILIDSFIIQKICIRIGHSNDFNFISSGGLGMSMTQKRCRMKQEEEKTYYVFLVTNLQAKVDLAIENQIKETDKNKKLKQMSSLLKIQKIKITLGKQKVYGHSSLKHLQQRPTSECFLILHNQNQICIIAEKKDKKFLSKAYNLKMNIGGSTLIKDSLEQFKNISKKIERSQWKKFYTQPKQKKQSTYSESKIKVTKKDTVSQGERILVMLPESVFRLTFQYANLIKIVDEQTILIKQFVLNEQIEDHFVIKNRIRKWVKSIIKNNLGGVISGTALGLIGKLFTQIIGLNIAGMSKVFGFIFQSNE